MSRRPATCFRSLFGVAVAAIALTGCSGGGHEAQAPQPVAASKPAQEPEPTPAETPAPAPTPVPPADAAAAEPVTPAPVAQQTAPPTPAPDTTAKPSPRQEQLPDPLKTMQDSEARRYDYERRLAEAKTNLETANLQMATWERNVLAFKNPFLARPQLSPEDSAAIAGLNGAERVRWAEARLSTVSLARDAAQKTLDDLKANPPVN